MKKITQSSVPGGAPIYLDDFKGPFNLEIWDGMEALLSAYDADVEGLIIQGCVVGGAGPYTLSAGIVYLNGDFMRIDAQTGLSLPQYIQPLSAVNTSRQFDDGSNQVLFIEKSATVAGSAPGAGQYVAITTTTDPDDRRLGRLSLVDVGTNTLRTKVLSIGDWNMDADLLAFVTHGLPDFKKIRQVSVMIRNDSDAAYVQLEAGGYAQFGSTDITLVRAGSGTFDSTEYNATGYNRGFVTITYEA